MTGKPDEGQAVADACVFQGMSTCGRLCICPKLQEFASDELRMESSVMKERCTAREERNFAGPPKGSY